MNIENCTENAQSICEIVIEPFESQITPAKVSENNQENCKPKSMSTFKIIVKRTAFEKIIEDSLKICEESIENVFLIQFRIE